MLQEQEDLFCWKTVSETEGTVRTLAVVDEESVVSGDVTLSGCF